MHGGGVRTSADAAEANKSVVAWKNIIVRDSRRVSGTLIFANDAAPHRTTIHFSNIAGTLRRSAQFGRLWLILGFMARRCFTSQLKTRAMLTSVVVIWSRRKPMSSMTVSSAFLRVH